MMNGSGVGMKPKNWRAADANGFGTLGCEKILICHLGSRKGSMDQELRLPSPQQSVRNLEQSDELDGRQPQEKACDFCEFTPKLNFSRITLKLS
jgi:hypothetical protein